MLEQIAYEVAPRLQTPQSQSTYQVSYLENLSATALYTGEPAGGGGNNIAGGSTPKPGMKLPGGLEIKNVTPESVVMQEDFGGAGNIYTAHPNGNGSTRFYGPKKSDGTRNVDKSNW